MTKPKPVAHTRVKQKGLDRAAIMRRVCERISNGALVVHAAKAEGITAWTVRSWAALTPELSTLYARAREDQAHAIAEEAITLADSVRGGTSEEVQAVRLAVDTRKWMASKIAPRHYGEKFDMTSGGKRLAGVVLLPADDE